MNPQIDYEWVPDSLKAFTQGWMGSVIIALVICLCILAVWWVAGRMSSNFYIRNNRAGIAMVCVLAAAAIIASLPHGVQWGTSINPVGGGIPVSAGASSDIQVNRSLANSMGLPAATSLAHGQNERRQAKKDLSDAKRKLQEHHPLQAAGAAASGVKHALAGAADGVKAGFQYVQHHGVANTIRDGWHAVTSEVGNWFHR